MKKDSQQFKLSDWDISDNSLRHLLPRILLFCRDGIPQSIIAEKMGIHRRKVNYWIQKLVRGKIVELKGDYPKIPVLTMPYDEARVLVEKMSQSNTQGSERCLNNVMLATVSPSGVAGGEVAGGSGRPFHSPLQWSCHKGSVRFWLRGSLPVECHHVAKKTGKKYWYSRDAGVSIVGDRRSVQVNVHGVPLKDSVEATREAVLELATSVVLDWAKRYSVRLHPQGELVGRREWVLEDKVASARVIELLNLDKQAVRLGLSDWFTDSSHPDKVEVAGSDSDEQVKEFGFLVNGDLRSKLELLDTRLSSLETSVNKSLEVQERVVNLLEKLLSPVNTNNPNSVNPLDLRDRH